MKRVLFVMLALVVGLTAIAQVKNPVKKSSIYNASYLTKAETLGKIDLARTFAPGEVMTKAPATQRSTRDYDEWETMVTRYDLQSNAFIGNRFAVWDDGTAAVTATWASDNNFTTRGTGYNYYDGEDFGDQPDARIESVKSGWPSITALGNGELLTSHASGVHMYKRETKGEGDWTEIHTFTDDDYQGLGAGDWTWAKIATTGNGQYVHMVMADSWNDSESHSRSIVTYCRSTDGGETFSERENPPLVDPEEYRYDIGGDDYIIATNGDRIAILFGGYTFDLFYIYSEDNGETWTKQTIWNYRAGEHACDWGDQTIGGSLGDTIWSTDNSASIAIDNDGVVHVAFGLGRWAPAPESGWGYLSRWYFTFGIVYWNSNYENEQGGHEIPDFGQWSGDSQFTDEWFTTHGANYTLMDERLAGLAEQDGYRNLNLITADENHNDTLDYDGEILNNVWGTYRNWGVYTFPSISIDENNNMIMAFSSLSESRTGELPDGKLYYLRNLIIDARDESGQWFYDAFNLNEEYSHSSEEAFSVTAHHQGRDNNFWVAYSADREMGLVLDYTSGDNAQSQPSNNTIYAVKVNPSDLPNWMGTHEVVNPMTSARVYPNPTNGTLYIEVNASQSANAVMSVFNIMGQKVAEQSASISTGLNTTSINTSELSTGIYFVNVKANGFEKTMKFVVK